MIKINEIIKKDGEYYKRVSLPTVKKYIKSLSDNSFMELFLVGNKANIYNHWINLQYEQISNLKELEEVQNEFYYYDYSFGKTIHYYLRCNSKGDVYLNLEKQLKILEELLAEYENNLQKENNESIKESIINQISKTKKEIKEIDNILK